MSIMKRFVILKLRCPQCLACSGYARIKTNERVCKNCGYVGKVKEFEWPKKGIK